MGEKIVVKITIRLFFLISGKGVVGVIVLDLRTEPRAKQRRIDQGLLCPIQKQEIGP